MRFFWGRGGKGRGVEGFGRLFVAGRPRWNGISKFGFERLFEKMWFSFFFSRRLVFWKLMVVREDLEGRRDGFFFFFCRLSIVETCR